MSVVPEFLKANERYAASFKKGSLPMPPARKVAVIACMDARLDPARALGLEEGDAHVIRNAGGRAALEPQLDPAGGDAAQGEAAGAVGRGLEHGAGDADAQIGK